MDKHNVYLVMKIQDFEYGCRAPVAAFSSYDKAEAYINETGNPYHTFWNDTVKPYYTIEVLEVN